jgi:hypothetical protein
MKTIATLRDKQTNRTVYVLSDKYKAFLKAVPTMKYLKTITWTQFVKEARP